AFIRPDIKPPPFIFGLTSKKPLRKRRSHLLSSLPRTVLTPAASGTKMGGKRWTNRKRLDQSQSGSVCADYESNEASPSASFRLRASHTPTSRESRRVRAVRRSRRSGSWLESS